MASITEQELKAAAAAHSLTQKNPEGFSTAEYTTAIGLNPLRPYHRRRARRALHVLKNAGLVRKVEIVRENLAEHIQPISGWRATSKLLEMLDTPASSGESVSPIHPDDQTP